MFSPLPRTALVLSAGGIRGAYQVGVLAGLVDVLGLRGEGPPLFDIVTGTSIGAINAALAAANAQRMDHDVDALIRMWTGLEFDAIMPLAPLLRRRGAGGRSLFDVGPLLDLLARTVAWDRLHANICCDLVHALIIAVLDVADGRTTLFAELAPGAELRPSAYPRQRTLLASIDVERVLASASLPGIFPPRPIEGRYYVDGAVRFSTPISPALRAGAERAVVVSLLHRAPARALASAPATPGLSHLLGKILDALLLDPIVYDLENLLRANRTIGALAGAIGPEALARATDRLEADGILFARRVPVLIFRPSEDLGQLAARFVREVRDDSRFRWTHRALLRWVSRADVDPDADLASILLIDGRLAARLIELGRRDAHAAADRILAFFAGTYSSEDGPEGRCEPAELR